jgi:histidinol-phosphate aminotransferase
MMSKVNSEQSIKVREAISCMGYYDPPLENRNPEEYMLMDFNEPPLPPPPEVIEKIAELLKNRIHTYPIYGDFLEKLGEYVGVPTENLLLTNGSDQGIDVILRCLLENGDEVKMTQPGFPMFRQVAGTLGCSVDGPKFPRDFSFPHQELKASVTGKTRLIVVINPNNPTGSAVSLEQIEDLLKSFPDIPVLVDEAYYEFSGETCVSFLSSYPNLIVIRTFSKALGMPSLRLGYVIARPDFIIHLQKIRGPYDVNVVAVFAAREQLQRPEHWQGIVKHLLEESKPALENFFDENQVKYYSNKTNFMLVEPEDPVAACKFLKDNKILVRPMGPPISHTFRMSLRMLPDMQRFMEVYSRFLNT